MAAAGESRWARWLGVLWLSRRQLQQRWLESLLIVLGLALGVGVLTAGETFVRYQQTRITEALASTVPERRAVVVRPRAAALRRAADYLPGQGGAEHAQSVDAG